MAMRAAVFLRISKLIAGCLMFAIAGNAYDRQKAQESMREAQDPIANWSGGTAREKKVLAISPNGKFFVAQGSVGELIFWSLPSGEKLGEATVSSESLNGLEFDTDGRSLISRSRKGVVIWSVEGLSLAKRFEIKFKDISGVAFSSDGAKLYTAEGSAIRIRNSRDGTLLGEWKSPRKSINPFRRGDAFTSIAASPSGKFVLSTDLQGFVMRWAVDDGSATAIATSKWPGATWSVEVAPDRKNIAFLADEGNSNSRHLFVVAPTGQIFPAPFFRPAEARLNISRDGFLVAGAEDNSISIFDLAESGKDSDANGFRHVGGQLRKIFTIDKRPEQIADLDVSSDGKFLVVGFSDGRISVWDLAAASKAVKDFWGNERKVIDGVVAAERSQKRAEAEREGQSFVVLLRVGRNAASGNFETREDCFKSQKDTKGCSCPSSKKQFFVHDTDGPLPGHLFRKFECR